MWHTRIWLIASIAMTLLLPLGVFAALTLDSNFGEIETSVLTIIDGDKELSALLYRPKSVDAQTPAPAIVIAHGICGTKEMMSSIGLELARRGFVSLCLDLLGHGESQGTIEEGRIERDFGVYSIVQYLKSKPYVNSSALGLVGHSLGAGAVKATVAHEPQIGATVLVAGGLGDNLGDSQYDAFNLTYPRNLLVIIGKYDVLFDIKELTTNALLPAFGTQVVPSVLYGEFSSQTARKLVIPSTTHLLEPVDPTAISEIVAWIENAFGRREVSAGSLNIGFTYLQREAAILLALVGLVGTTLLAFYPIKRLVNLENPAEIPMIEKATPHKWKLFAVWGAINLILLVPMFGVGSVVPFPPLVFGSSIAWWMMISGLTGLFVLTRFSKNIIERVSPIKEILRNRFNTKDILGAAISFTVVLAIATILATSQNFTFRIISPIFRDFASPSRAAMFTAFMPFFIAYFLVESFYLHELSQHSSQKSTIWKDLHSYFTAIIGKISPFLGLLLVHYASKIVFDVWILPGFAGFLMEFLWLILPIFTITTSISWWFYKKTQRVAYGILLNTMLMSWVASVVFPF